MTFDRLAGATQTMRDWHALGCRRRYRTGFQVASELAWHAVDVELDRESGRFSYHRGDGAATSSFDLRWMRRGQDAQALRPHPVWRAQSTWSLG